MLKRMAVMLAALALLFGGIFGFKLVQGYFIGNYFANFQPPPVTISAVRAKQEQWQPYVTAIGTLNAVNGVDISAETDGRVKAIHFQSGLQVKAGELLLEIDSQVEQASLKSQRARLKLVQLNFDRDNRLLARKLISQDQFDRSKAELDEARASVEGTQAVIDKKNLLAPFDGRIGIRQVDIGQYVSAGTMITTLQAIDTLYIDFYVPEQLYPSLHAGQSLRFSVGAWPGETFAGVVSAVNAKVDPNTRNILVRGTVANPNGQLLPGMFATLRLMQGNTKYSVTVPQTAVTYNLYGESVFLVEEAPANEGEKPVLTARLQSVKTGETLGDQVVITQGVSAGDLVVIDGQIKLSNGRAVILANEAGVATGEGGQEDSATP